MKYANKNSARTWISDYVSAFLDLNNLAFQSMQNMLSFFSFIPVLLAFKIVIAMEIRLKSVSGKPFHKMNVNWIFTRLQKIQERYYAWGKALCLCRMYNEPCNTAVNEKKNMREHTITASATYRTFYTFLYWYRRSINKNRDFLYVVE